MFDKVPQIPEKERPIYENFISWLKQSWYGVPDSDVLLPYVAARYTPEEADFLTGMPFAPKTLAELSDLTKTSTDVLRPKRYGHSGSLTPSNFQVHTNDETCAGCGLCIKRCPMEALHLKDAPAARGRKTTIIDEQGKERQLTNKTGKVSEVNINLCIGCGVCAYKCPAKSLSLHRNMADHHPPETGRDWMVQFMSQRNAGV